MSNNNNERRELTAAELDLVAGGIDFTDIVVSSFRSSETQTQSIIGVLIGMATAKAA
jgi:hypothetical protein